MSAMMTVYVVILAASVGLLLVSVILDGIFDFLDGSFDWIEGIFDLGDVLDADVGTDTSGIGASSLFAGLMGFGAVGAIATSLGASTALAAIAAGGGFFALGTVVYLALFFLFTRTEGSSDISRTSYQGATAEVTSAIPEQGMGLVQILVPGTNTVVSETARTVGNQRIETGTTVVIDEVGPSALVVSPQVSPTETLN